MIVVLSGVHIRFLVNIRQLPKQTNFLPIQTMKLGDISISYARLLLDTVQQLGGNHASLSEQYQLATKLNRPGERVSIPRFMRMGFSAIQDTGRPDVGLEMGKHVRIPLLGLPGFLAMTAPNLAKACQVITMYERLSSTNCRGQSQFYMDNGKGIASFYSISPYNEYNLFVVDSVLSSWYRVIQWLTGKNDAVERVEVEFDEPDYVQAYHAFFNCPVLFGQKRNCLVIRSDALEWPLLQSDPITYQSMKVICDQQLAEATRNRNLSEKVRDVISPLLEGQTPSIEQVAENLGMPPWTLRRKLQDEETSFQDLLNETRQGLAESYIKDTDLALGEIAYLLGFSSPTAFQRAFKRWAGQSPGQYRKQRRLLAV